MIKNIRLKKFLINTVFVFLSKINKAIPKKKNRVLLYSNMGFRDNIEALYNFMLENDYNEKYEIICSTNDFKSLKNRENVKFVSQLKGVFYFLSSSKIYYCFGRIPILPTSRQVTVQMWHGTSFKGFDDSMKATNSLKKQFYTWTFSSSEFFIPIVSIKFAVPKDSVYLCGHPRTDIFFEKLDINELQGKDRKKNIVWLPTFRKSNVLGYEDSDSNSSLPIFHTLEELRALDKYLEEIKLELVIKLHPLQNEFEYTNEVFKNIQIYTNERFENAGLNLYKILKYSEALITDYSSVFYDYLLLDKPIGFTEDDISSYSDKRGFAVDDPDKFRPGEKIKNSLDFERFLLDISEGTDIYKEDRKEINNIVNKYQDGENSKRALELAGIKL